MPAPERRPKGFDAGAAFEEVFPGDWRLKGVSETLFVPLYALAIESRTESPIVVDNEVVDLTSQLDQSFAHSPKKFFQRLAEGQFPRTLVVSLALRIRQYDKYVRSFVEQMPNGIIVNMGCGLDNRPSRLKNSAVDWHLVDLPEVIGLRRELLPDSDSDRSIPSSVLDFEWLNALPSGTSGNRFLFLAEGLFMYLPPEGVRELVVRIAERFPGAELVAEVAHRRIVRLMHTRLGRRKFRRQLGLSEDVVYHCGFESSRDMEAWAPGVEFLDEWTYFDDSEPKLGWMRLLGRFRLFRYAQWTVHYRLGTPPAGRGKR